MSSDKQINTSDEGTAKKYYHVIFLLKISSFSYDEFFFLNFQNKTATTSKFFSKIISEA